MLRRDFLRAAAQAAAVLLASQSGVERAVGALLQDGVGAKARARMLTPWSLSALVGGFHAACKDNVRPVHLWVPPIGLARYCQLIQPACCYVDSRALEHGYTNLLFLARPVIGLRDVPVDVVAYPMVAHLGESPWDLERSVPGLLRRRSLHRLTGMDPTLEVLV